MPGRITEEEFAAILLFTIASFSRADNSFSAGGVYMSDIASVASVLGSFGSPSFLSKNRLNLARKCTEGRSRETRNNRKGQLITFHLFPSCALVPFVV